MQFTLNICNLLFNSHVPHL